MHTLSFMFFSWDGQSEVFCAQQRRMGLDARIWSKVCQRDKACIRLISRCLSHSDCSLWRLAFYWICSETVEHSCSRRSTDRIGKLNTDGDTWGSNKTSMYPKVTNDLFLILFLLLLAVCPMPNGGKRSSRRTWVIGRFFLWRAIKVRFNDANS